MDDTQKRVLIIAGANGTGKTTFALEFLRENDFEFLNADEFAKQLDHENPAAKKIGAGKMFFQKLHAAVAQNKSLLVETTLSGKYLKDFFELWRQNGYLIEIVFVFVESPEVSIERIADRVKKGGHFVPDDDVRRRVARGKRNFWLIYKDLADSWSLFYNSESGFNRVASGDKDSVFITNKFLFDKFSEEFR